MRGSAWFQVVRTAAPAFSGSVGEGEFTVKEDRQKLAPVMRNIVRNKLLLSLQAGDFPAYRQHLNLQAMHLRGLDAEPVCNVIPGNRAGPREEDDPVTTFMYQNGLLKIRAKDSAGFWPLHYGALSGNVEVAQGLLARRADPNRKTAKPPWMSALDLAIFYRHLWSRQEFFVVFI